MIARAAEIRSKQTARYNYDRRIFFTMEIKKGEERRDGFGDRGFLKKKKKIGFTYISSSHLQSLVNFSYSHRRSRFQGKRPLLTR